jgi:predicted PolB exonuclease-like 3'-5' exonuclease
MKHIHEQTGKSFDVGRLIDFDGKTFDINVITLWDEENDFEQNPVIVDYYFGDYEKEVTDNYINTFIERQNVLRTSLKFLKARLIIDGDYMDPAEIKELKSTIKSIEEMLTDLV